jgi:hypothetical protein
MIAKRRSPPGLLRAQISRGPVLLLLGVLAGCSGTTVYRYPLPGSDDILEVTVEPGSRSGPRKGVVNTVYLVGARPAVLDATGSYRARDKIKLGTFEGTWAPASIAWISAATVNICPLNKTAGVPNSVDVLVTERTRAAIHITTDCDGKPAYWVAPAPTAPSSGQTAPAR